VDIIKPVDRMKKRIQELKKEKNAVMLCHNYQVPEVQDVGDYIGDSLGLSKAAAKTDADVIMFAGVDFMAESAKILSPGKKVVIPSGKARCPMAAMIDVEGLNVLKSEHPDAAVVAYVNTTAEIKAEVDVCCTSSNAVKVVKGLPNREIIFIPDTNLGLYVQREVPEKKLVFCQGYCHVHQAIRADDIKKMKELYPGAEVLVHPECPPEVIDLADGVLSTQGMMDHAANSRATEFIIGTEKDMCYRLSKEHPDKIFHPLDWAICHAMKKINLENVLTCLESLEPEVTLSEDIIKKARIPLERMMEAGRGE